ncbi:MAG: helix-turn-helix transcriptional regulator [Bacillota bacterium]
MILGEKILELRKKNNLSREELADKLNMPVGHLEKIETGKKKVSDKLAEKIISLFNITEDEFIKDCLQSEVTVYMGDKIRALRESKGLSLAQLGTLTHLSTTYLSELERNESIPSLSALRQIADVFEVPLSLFIGNKRKNMLVIEKLKRARQLRGMSQKDLAMKAGLSPGLIGQLETGKVHASLKTIEKICSALGISVCSLILEQEEVEEIIGALSPELRELLFQPQVQTILASTCTLEPEKLKLVLNFIDMLNNPKV